MRIEDIRRRWEKQTKIAARTAFWTRIWIGYITFVNAIGALGLVVYGIAILAQIGGTGPQIALGVVLGIFEIVMGVVNGVLTWRVLTGVRTFVARRLSIDSDTEHFTQLTDRGKTLVLNTLLPISEAMGLLDRKYVFLRPKESGIFSPGVVEKPDGTVLVAIPPDFLALIGQKPNLARAMLAHELGHVIQKDTKLWLYASAFAEELLQRFLPLNLAIASLVVIECLIMLLIRGSSALTAAVGLTALAFVGVFGLWFFYNRIRRYRRRSEELADLASWLYVGHEDGSLKDCFILDQAKAKPGQGLSEADLLVANGFFGETAVGRWAISIHPRADQRLKQVELYDALEQGKRRRLKLTSYNSYALYGVLLVPLIVFLAPVFSAAGKAAKTALCISNEKQLALATVIYANDFDDRFPLGNVGKDDKDLPDPTGDSEARTWPTELLAYLSKDNPKEILRCPSVPMSAVGGYDKPDATSYLLNGLTTDISDTAISVPADAILFHENNVVGPPLEAPCVDQHFEGQAYHFNSDAFDVNHDAAPVAFCDGHAKSMPKGQLTYHQFGATDQTKTLEITPEAAKAAYSEDYQINTGDDGVFRTWPTAVQPG